MTPCASLLGDDLAAIEGLASRVRAHTGGNPFFVLEAARALDQDGGPLSPG